MVWSRNPLRSSSMVPSCLWLLARISPRSELTWQAMPSGTLNWSAEKCASWPLAVSGCGNWSISPATMRAEATSRWSRENIIC